jgi:hypothetical protein
MSNFNVQDFLKTLENSKPQANNSQFSGRSPLEKVYLNFPENYGKYQIFPMNSTVTGFPFIPLNDTREVKVNRTHQLQDGTVQKYETWIKILPDGAYVMNDQTGRLVSSLTAEDKQLLDAARTIWDQLYEEMGGNQRTTDGSMNKAKDYLRIRNYTIFNAKCLNKWSITDQRKPVKQNFAALFVCTAKGFVQAISDNIEDGKISHGGDIQWLDQIYNRELENRQGYLIFSIALNQGGKVGYTVTATHESDRGQYLTNFGITNEEAELMQDPVETFLGWQAGREGNGRLFNRQLMKETIDFMTNELAAIRMAKSTGVSIEDAIKNVQQTAISGTQQQQPTTLDPMLQQQGAPGLTNPQAIMNPAGIDPTKNPPAAQIDPVSQSPIGGAAVPGFGTPQFAQGYQNPFNK